MVTINLQNVRIVTFTFYELKLNRLSLKNIKKFNIITYPGFFKRHRSLRLERVLKR
jgi:hypothetical protein